MTPHSSAPAALCQQALARVLTYLGDLGVTLDVTTCAQALRLVESALGDGITSDLPGQCIQRIPDYFQPIDDAIPPASPDLERGCIGYE
ncbi:hypothetical protein [Marinobacter confluentis]|uniref:Uncharacterized protein n=1 Tax=Marinobacter confluentis TaxID=1697557 RepID=A0A4Z1C510_9GAMM|nr:hypothetical protein [Marinobacter confluentis]TGN41501.1 hypothetical protein E5Q11_02910 [Marinobacter confluentis]